MGIKLIAIIVLILVIGVWSIKSSYDLDLKEGEDQKTLVVQTGRWLRNVGTNVVRTVGFAAKQNWTPEKNDTNITIMNITND